MLHALKHQCPIDNFEVLKIGEDGLEGRRIQADLTEAVQAFNPLTVPFERVRPLIRSQYYLHVYPGEDEMRQHITLMERLHRLRRP